VLPAPLNVTNGAGKVLNANPALAGLLDIDLGRLVGNSLSVYVHHADEPVLWL
jgi:hypothetical protein